MSDARRVFHDFLTGKSLKLTRQRERILTVFLESGKHLSAEELYDILKKEDPSIGQATVFRTLKLLCDAEIASVVNLGNKTIRYEPKFGHEHHDHLCCLKCGRFIEAMDSEIEKLQEKLCRKFGFEPKWHRLEIFGLCKDCKD